MSKRQEKQELLPFTSVFQEMMTLLGSQIQSPIKRNIWRITPAKMASQPFAILRMTVILELISTVLASWK